MIPSQSQSGSTNLVPSEENPCADMVEHFQFYNKGDNYDQSLPPSEQCPMEFFQSQNSSQLKTDDYNVVLQGARFLARHVLPYIHTIASNALKMEINQFEKLFEKIPQLYSLRSNHYWELNGMCDRIRIKSIYILQTSSSIDYVLIIYDVCTLN